MKEPVLVILAAGMGNRYGGLKQIDPIDNEKNIIIDFSLFDAIKAGFKKAIFIIKPEIEAKFKEVIGNRISKHIEVAYAYQKVSSIPEEFDVPEGREKPWGTGHALMSCEGLIEGPFAIINADDYYGITAYKTIYNYLKGLTGTNYCMVGYTLENTLTEFGYVSRGVCTENADGYLKRVIERTRIEKTPQGPAYTEDDSTWVGLDSNTTVSMNMWGFGPQIFDALGSQFKEFLIHSMPTDPKKSEYFLPSAVSRLIENNLATVKVLKSQDKWYGVTYKEDKQTVVEAVARLKEKGIYPEKLWGDR